MRIAALYDIHGNLPALEAVLAEIHTLGVEHMVVGGDVVAGPMPVEALDRLRAEGETLPVSYIHGNAESEVLRCAAGQPIGGLSPVADDAARWVAAQLRPDQLQFLATWPLSVTLTLADGRDVLFCHATPQNDTDVFTAQTPDHTVRALLGEVAADVLVCGHTHMQFQRTVGATQVVNAGSVGMPFGHTGAHWLLLDGESAGDVAGGLAFQRTDYDRERAAERIRQSSDPEAEQFAAQNVLRAPAVSDAMAMLTGLEQRQAQARAEG